MTKIFRRLFWPVVLLLIVVAMGTYWFEEIEGLSHFEAFYLTVLTITTVGYGDIVPVTTAGRILAMGLVVTGFTFFTAVVITVTQSLSERQEDIRRSLQLQTLVTLFYSEVGDRLIRLLSGCDPDLPCIQEPTPPEKVWTSEDYSNLVVVLKDHTFNVNINQIDVANLKNLLDSPLLVNLLENPQVFDNPLFNTLLREMFHIKGELAVQTQISGLPDKLKAHLSGDLTKIYSPAVKLWLEHMKYLEKAYPSLFMTILETNPFGVAKTERSCPSPFPINTG